MSTRELFNAIMHYETFDRMPVIHWNGWPETTERWYGEGLPRDMDQCDFFNAHPLPPMLPVDLNLFPLFEEKVIEETDEHRLVRQNDGVTAVHYKNQSAIPHHTDFLFKDRSGWEEYKKRLQPDPRRIPENFDAIVAEWQQRDLLLGMWMGSMVGFTRNWMGVENFCVACCEDPTLIAEVADVFSDLVCWAMDQVLPRVTIDIGWGWEDICFRTGPLVPPNVFKDAAVPAYRKIADKLNSYGVDLYAVDCDGYIDDLVPLWLEGGVNVMFPVEIGAWHADPMAFRRQYGKELRVFGGIDKLALERGRKAIDAEIERRIPLMKEGGFVPLPDHLITPDTPLDDYRYYLDRIRELRF